MLTGKRAFDGASAASVTAAILERPAPTVAGIAPANPSAMCARCWSASPPWRCSCFREVRSPFRLKRHRARPPRPLQRQRPPIRTSTDAKAKGLVWVDTNSKVYHKEGQFYGKTKRGQFMLAKRMLDCQNSFRAILKRSPTSSTAARSSTTAAVFDSPAARSEYAQTGFPIIAGLRPRWTRRGPPGRSPRLVAIRHAFYNLLEHRPDLLTVVMALHCIPDLAPE